MRVGSLRRMEWTRAILKHNSFAEQQGPFWIVRETRAQSNVARLPTWRCSGLGPQCYGLVCLASMRAGGPPVDRAARISRAPLYGCTQRSNRTLNSSMWSIMIHYSPRLTGGTGIKGLWVVSEWWSSWKLTGLGYGADCRPCEMHAAQAGRSLCGRVDGGRCLMWSRVEMVMGGDYVA